MTLTVKFACDGCYKETTGTKRLERHFNSFNGSGYGFGTYMCDTPQDVAPEGWIAFDPYTGCCYCPECWSSIETKDPIDEQAIRKAGVE